MLVKWLLTTQLKNQYVKSSEAYNNYKSYCTKYDYIPMSKHSFYETLTQRGLTKLHRRDANYYYIDCVYPLDPKMDNDDDVINQAINCLQEIYNEPVSPDKTRQYILAAIERLTKVINDGGDEV